MSFCLHMNRRGGWLGRCDDGMASTLEGAKRVAREMLRTARFVTIEPVLSYRGKPRYCRLRGGKMVCSTKWDPRFRDGLGDARRKRRRR